MARNTKATKPAPTSTPVRNSAIPKVSKTVAVQKVITHDMIARRAYEIWKSGKGGSELENWNRAEAELRA